ncbi:MAG: stability determinant [Blastomonas sp.]
MAATDPLFSSFTSEDDAAAYDAWFRDQVETGLSSSKPGIPHEIVMGKAREIIARYTDAKPHRGN